MHSSLRSQCKMRLFLWFSNTVEPQNKSFANCLLNLLSLCVECDELHPCQGLGEHAHFRSFGMAFLTLFRIATGDNWNGIMKDTLREECEDGDDCLRNCCVSPYFAPLFFVVFVLMAQFVLVNVVVAVLMKHLEESHKQVNLGLKIRKFLWHPQISLERNAAMGAHDNCFFHHLQFFLHVECSMSIFRLSIYLLSLNTIDLDCLFSPYN